MYYTYILKTNDDSYYIGSCNELDVRFGNHQAGRVKYTKSRLPVEIVHSEQFATLSEARKRELQIKKWKSGKAIEKLIHLSK